MKIKREKLLLLACLIWVGAGINILYMGSLSWQRIYWLYEVVGAGVVFYLFTHFVFQPLVKKHCVRISKYNTLEKFYKFFDKQSFLIMIVMMAMGIAIRKLNLMPQLVMALFYTGLGCALLFSGLCFGKIYVFQMLNIQRKEKI